MNSVGSESSFGTNFVRKKMLRIGLISPYSLTIPGGVQAQVLGLARELRRMGHEARVLGPCDGPPPEPFVTPLGNSLPTAANGSIVPLAPDPSAALRTIRAINDEAFDVLHLHEPIAPGPTVTALLLRLAPMVGTFHAAGDIAWYGRLSKGVNWIADFLDARVAVSPQARELAHRYLGGEYEILFNGIESDLYFRPNVLRGETKSIFFCGRYEPRKGLAVLLEAFEKIADDVELWVASDGEGIEELKAKYSQDSRIAWLGRITDAEKIDRLAKCSVFCAPSLHSESFGIVVLEAMASGAPVVASSLEGYRNVATHDVNGLLIEPGDVRGLTESLAKIIDDKQLAERLRQNGLERAKELSMRHLAEIYVEIYHKVLERESFNPDHHPKSRVVRMFSDRVLRKPQRL
ncbi:MAG: glycosyltransferase family 4 protein [Acidimicrobiaceae bacterium]